MDRTPTDLPVEAYAAEIMAAIGDGSLVLTAEPGAGKSSVVPLLAEEVIRSRGETGRVIVLEPRRLAARATANRLASLVGEAGVGASVGLTMRGERRVSAKTRIEVVTEAVLTARLQRDPELADTAVLVFDEFHERNLHSDLGLAMALEVRSTIRPDLAIVVMSATLDTAPVANLLGSAAPIGVPGRTFPVETVHLQRPAPRSWADAVADATRSALAEVAGDVLVFVPGRREIADVSRRLAGCGAEVIPLHGGSDGPDHRRILAVSSTDGRRVVVATAVAETSVTLPRIEAVVDGGLLRRARFDPGTGLGRLETRNVTRFSADQRRGRAGRLGPGRCYRLWSTEDHRLLDEAVPPEIVDGDPLPVAFELARWGDPSAEHLPLLDHPGAERLAAGQQVLADLDLVDANGAVTERGTKAGRLGIHPRLGALLLTARDLDLVETGAMVAALLDSDRFSTTADLASELDRRSSELRSRAAQLIERLQPKAGRRPRGSRNQGKRAGDSPTSASGSVDEIARLLAAAWPDRIAKRRSNTATSVTTDEPARFLMANGREGMLTSAAGRALSDAPFLVIAEADGEARRATIRRAVPIERAAALDAAAATITTDDEVGWDERAAKVVAERVRRLGAIVLNAEPLPAPPPALIADGIAEGLRSVGLQLLRWSDGAIAVRERLRWLHEVDPQGWPPVGEADLIDRLDEWLDVSRCRTAADVASLRVGPRSLLDLLDWEQRATFDELAPPELAVPSGRLRPVDYSTGRPVWAVRIQDLFGLDDHPTIGPNREPITIELLSPANRPAQTTTDLPNFWRGSYAAVRRDLRGRYPKHAWPEHPWR